MSASFSSREADLHIAADVADQINTTVGDISYPLVVILLTCLPMLK